MAVKPLSRKQEKIIKFVANFLDDNGYPPTTRDIAGGCGISSTSVVAYNLNKLEEAGYLRGHSDISRGIELNQQRVTGGAIHVPVIGEIAAGEPIPVPAGDVGNMDSTEKLEVGEELVRGRERVYALRVKGDCMVDALTGDGDIVLMDYVNTAENGDMVAVWLKKEQEVTLKKFFIEGDRIRLEPANKRLKPIYTDPDNVEVQGKVVAVIRRIP